MLHLYRALRQSVINCCQLQCRVSKEIIHCLSCWQTFPQCIVGTTSCSGRIDLHTAPNSPLRNDCLFWQIANTLPTAPKQGNPFPSALLFRVISVEGVLFQKTAQSEDDLCTTPIALTEGNFLIDRCFWWQCLRRACQLYQQHHRAEVLFRYIALVSCPYF